MRILNFPHPWHHLLSSAFFFPVPFDEMTILTPTEWYWHPGWKSIDQGNVGIFLDTQSYSWSIYQSLCNTTLPWTLWLFRNLKLKVWVLQFCSFSRFFGLLWVFYIFIEILGSSCQFLQKKKIEKVSIEVTLNLLFNLRIISILTLCLVISFNSIL